MIDFLLFIIVAAICGMVGFVVLTFALQVVLEILTPVVRVTFNGVCWGVARISRWLPRDVPPPCF